MTIVVLIIWYFLVIFVFIRETLLGWYDSFVEEGKRRRGELIPCAIF